MGARSIVGAGKGEPVTRQIEEDVVGGEREVLEGGKWDDGEKEEDEGNEVEWRGRREDGEKEDGRKNEKRLFVGRSSGNGWRTHGPLGGRHPLC